MEIGCAIGMYLHEHRLFVTFKLCLCMITFISKLTMCMAELKIRRRLDAEEMNRGIGILEAELSQRHAAGVHGVSHSTVARVWEWFRTHGNVRHRHGGDRGGNRVTTQSDDRLTHYQMTNFRLFQTEGDWRRQFQI